MDDLSNPQFILAVQMNHQTRWRCILCATFLADNEAELKAHEDTPEHIERVRDLDFPVFEDPSTPSRSSFGDSDTKPSWIRTPSKKSKKTSIWSGLPSSPTRHPSHDDPDGRDIFLSDTEEFPTSLPAALPFIHGPALPSDDVGQIYDDFGGALATTRPPRRTIVEDTEDDSKDDEWRAKRNNLMSDGPLDVLDENPLEMYFSEDTRNLAETFAPHPSNTILDAAQWWPWKSKEEASLDLMGAFPRAMFSEQQLDITRWFANLHGVENLPTVKQVKDHRHKILDTAGLSSVVRESQLGNLFAHNDFVKIIQHEFSNPLVRPNLHTYPEDSGPRLHEARQARRWHHEVDSNIAAPMARSADGKDFYVGEPCLAHLDDGPRVVAPDRWFHRNGVLWSVAYPLRATDDNTGYIIDQRERIELELSSYILNVDDLTTPTCQAMYGLPQPVIKSFICEGTNQSTSHLEEWKAPSVNPWRIKARGKRVLAAPIWLYCDDTSGNTSKKWNKHNSILFTMAGLPRSLVQLLYNVHFVATSNIASPLEMAEYVRDALREAREVGIEAWDCHLDEDVLVVPWVLAFQGDNPMASEFASHIGMSGNMYCRVCRAQKSEDVRQGLRNFMTIGDLRSKHDTLGHLRTQEERVMDGAPSAVDGLATSSGCKDKYFMAFVAKLQDAVTAWRSAHIGQSAAEGETKTSELKRMLKELRKETMPTNIFNPILGLEDFDPNLDSPVEILHVVLLGVVKYWWRDAVSRQTSKTKDELKTRISSADVTGLGIPPPRGQTFVQYAGSLVGRDFRVILQIAPAVLQGLIPEPHYQGWLALCRLAPMVFQPQIGNLEEYISRLEEAIHDFLVATALWNIQWFNKAKFHLLLHLPFHIRRFGPAILYATETFESYNFVIRLRSIHSSKQAPSIDIARAFSHLHAVRHLISGGYITSPALQLPTKSRRQAGAGVLSLHKDKEFLGYMQLSGLFDEAKIGRYSPLFHCEWQQTLASTILGIKTNFGDSDEMMVCGSLVLGNGDLAELHGYVVYCIGDGSYVGFIEEILASPKHNSLVGIILRRCSIEKPEAPYFLPRCLPLNDESGHVLRDMASFKDCVSTVNTFHNCARNDCTVTKTRAVYQERSETGLFTEEITHQSNPYDRILNTAQLRSAEETQHWRSRLEAPGMSLEAAIDQALANRDAHDALTQATKDAKDAEKIRKEEEKAKKAEAKVKRAEAKAAKAKAKEAGGTSSRRVSARSTRKRKGRDEEAEASAPALSHEKRIRP